MSAVNKAIRLIIALGCLSIFWMAPRPAQAASFTVNDNRDLGDASPGNGVCAVSGGGCTLRAAVDEANALPGPNSVTIPGMTITLSSDLHIIDHTGHNDSVAINGAGQQATIIDGNNHTRLFYFHERSGSHSLSNLKLQNGLNTNTTWPDKNGGCINNEATLSLTNVTITNCRAFTGGGIYNQYASWEGNTPALNMTNVTLTNNTATGAEVGVVGGGAIFNGSALTANNVTISNNNAAAYGGGIYNNSYQTVSLTNFAIQNNTSHQGSGINNDLGDITLQNGTISGNIASCCRLSDNGASGGGGIYNNEGTLQVTSVHIADNQATSQGGYGGGIYNFQSMILTNVSLVNNRAHFGAGIYNGNYDGWPNSLSLTNVTISGNIGPASASLDSEGAGMFNTNNGHVTILNSTISRNSGESGSGITNRTVNTSVTIKNTILAENTDTWGAPDCRGTITSLNYNLLGNTVGTPVVRCTINLQSSDITGVLPLLDPLTGNPAYHPLQLGSAAVNRGTNNQCPSADIRGVSRPQGPVCDIGAYELQFNTSIKTVYSVVIITTR